MADTTTAFTGSVPENYDRFLGPLFFEPYARDLAKRALTSAPSQVLELAAGTGIVTAILRETLPATTAILATDLNPAMIACARGKPNMPANITWQQADAQQLPFEDERFDAVICQFGLMFLPDKPRGLREAFRVLKHGGRLLFSTWDGLERNPLGSEAHNYLSTRFPNDPPKFMLTPFGWSDVEAITGLVREAGFSQVRSEAVDLTARASNAEAVATGLLVGSPAAAQIAERGVTPADLVEGLVKQLSKRYGTGAFDTPMRAFVFEAVKA
jgi:SAM-dependent methyltransferase